MIPPRCKIDAHRKACFRSTYPSLITVIQLANVVVGNRASRFRCELAQFLVYKCSDDFTIEKLALREDAGLELEQICNNIDQRSCLNCWSGITPRLALAYITLFAAGLRQPHAIAMTPQPTE